VGGGGDDSKVAVRDLGAGDAPITEGTPGGSIDDLLWSRRIYLGGRWYGWSRRRQVAVRDLGAKGAPVTKGAVSGA
jgi:hypothetical protein